MKKNTWWSWGMSPEELEAIDEFLNPPLAAGTITLPIVANVCARQNYPSPVGPMDPERKAAAERGLAYIRKEQQRFQQRALQPRRRKKKPVKVANFGRVMSKEEYVLYMRFKTFDAWRRREYDLTGEYPPMSGFGDWRRHWDPYGLK
jgi:hypothetical protein